MMFRLAASNRSRAVGIATSETMLLHNFVLARVFLRHARCASVDQNNDTG